MSARMVALVLVAGGLAACSGAESDKSAAHQPAEKPAVVASIDAQSDVAGGLDSDKPLDRLKEVPGELGKSLGRVKDTVSESLSKVFAPRVETKEMEKNSKAQFILLAKRKERSKIDRHSKEDKDFSLRSNVKAKIVSYDVSEAVDEQLQYKALVLVEYLAKDNLEGTGKTDYKAITYYAIVAVRDPVVRQDGIIIYPELTILETIGQAGISAYTETYSLTKNFASEHLELLANKYF